MHQTSMVETWVVKVDGWWEWDTVRGAMRVVDACCVHALDDRWCGSDVR